MTAGDAITRHLTGSRHLCLDCTTGILQCNWGQLDFRYLLPNFKGNQLILHKGTLQPSLEISLILFRISDVSWRTITYNNQILLYLKSFVFYRGVYSSVMVISCNLMNQMEYLFNNKNNDRLVSAWFVKYLEISWDTRWVFSFTLKRQKAPTGFLSFV